VNALGQRLVADASVALEYLQDASVDVIKPRHGGSFDESRDPRKSLAPGEAMTLDFASLFDGIGCIL
jgi:hypothetical protein